MKRTVHLIRILSLFAAILLLACGCAANSAVKDDTAVAMVGDTKITYGEFTDLVTQYYSNYTQSFGPVTEEGFKNLRDNTLNELVDLAVLSEKAAAANPALTQEEQEYIDNCAETVRQSILDSYTQLAQQENAADVSARAMELINEELQKAGYESLDAYLADIQQRVTRYTLVEAFKRDFAKDITVSEKAVQAKYNTDLKLQKEKYDSAPADFETAQNTYDTNGGYPPVYAPTDYIRVKHILVDDIDTANDLIEQVNAGADFDELMAQYGKDPGMQREPNMSLGYLVCESTNFVQSFKDAAFALQNVGDLSAPTESMHGYHVIRLEKIIKAGAIPFEDVKDAYTNQLLLDTKSDALTKAMEGWRSEFNIQRFTAVTDHFTLDQLQQ